MDKEDLRGVKDQLEALDSLAKLFEKLWFAKVKNDIQDERVRAYLTVFDDAFPGFNQVVEFVRDSAGPVVDGDIGKVQQLFDRLAAGLLNNGSLDAPAAESEEKAAPDDIDTLFAEDDAGEDFDGAADDLFDDSGHVGPNAEEVEAILGGRDTEEEEIEYEADTDDLFDDPDEDDVVLDDDTDELEEDEISIEAEEIAEDEELEDDMEVEDLEKLLGTGGEEEEEVDLEELLGDDEEPEGADDDADLSALLADDEDGLDGEAAELEVDADEEDDDTEDLLEEVVEDVVEEDAGADIEDDEDLAELLVDDEEEGEEDDLAELLSDDDEEEEMLEIDDEEEVEEASDEEEETEADGDAISQDEIDALFEN